MRFMNVEEERENKKKCQVRELGQASNKTDMYIKQQTKKIKILKIEKKWTSI